MRALTIFAFAVFAADFAQAGAPLPAEIYAGPFQCGASAYSVLGQKHQDLGILEDYRVMREQTEVFISCVKEALHGKSDEWQLSHPYALMRDLYQVGLPYLQPSGALLGKLRREDIQAAIAQMEIRLSQFLKPAPGQKSVVADAETRELRKWLKSLQNEVQEQLDRGTSALARAAGDLTYGKVMIETSARFYGTLRRKLCKWKSVVDAEFQSRATDPTAIQLPGLPPQLIYCP